MIKADAKLQCWRDFAAGLQQDEHTQQVRWSVFHQSLHKPYASLSSFPDHVDGSLPASKTQSLTNLAHAYVAASIPSASLPQHIQQQVDDELAANPTSHMDASDAWQFTAADVKQQCTRQHTTTASGADGVEALFLKRGGEQLYRAIALLYSYSWQHSVIPQAWRDANVCSIYKGAGPKHAATSYRPISVTSMLVRTMEHIIHHQLTDRLEATSYFSADQFGFRHHRSTLDAIHCLLAKLKRGLRHGAGILPVIYLDLRKAFDRVCIPRLLHILSTRVGVRGRLWGWLRSFLTNRRIRACDRSDAGEWCSISYGVPQGAVLSPLLFLCYIHEMVQQLCDTPFRSPTNPHIRLQLNQCIHIWLFADDIALMPNYDAFHTTDGSVHSDWATALQQSLDTLSTWATDNCMEFNHTKSNIVYHATDIRWQQQRTAFHTQLQPSIGGAVLQPADHYTYLGLTISNDMTWTAQFDRMLARVRSDAHLVSRLIQSDNRPPYFTAIHALCKLYIRSRCTYAMQLWQPTDKQMRQLEYQMIRPVMHLLRLPRSTNRHGVLLDSGFPSLSRYRQYLLLRYTVRLAFDSAALQQLNPSVLDWNMDSVEHMQRAATRYNKQQLALQSTAAQAILTTQQWAINNPLLNPFNPTAAMLYCSNNGVNSASARNKLTLELKHMAMQQSLTDLPWRITPAHGRPRSTARHLACWCTAVGCTLQATPPAHGAQPYGMHACTATPQPGLHTHQPGRIQQGQLAQCSLLHT